jgi:thiol:disulfide interchange protein
MKTRSLMRCVLVALALQAGVPLITAASSSTRAKLYDETADGGKQIAEALAIAKKENKRVLLQFGANWCGWCHKLHALFQSNTAIADLLRRDYVTVLIDVNKEHNRDVDLKYGRPTKHGLPVIVILDSDAKQLTTQETGALEAGSEHSPEKVMAFLKAWSPKPPAKP